MGWEETSDPEAFWRATSVFLEARRVDVTVLISVADGLRRRGSSSRLAWFRDDDGAVAAVAIETPPHRPVVSAMSPEAVDALAGRWAPPARVLGPAATVRALVAAWGARPGDEVVERLHRLEHLATPATETPTQIAGTRDAAAVWDMTRDFHVEAVPADPPPRRAPVEEGLREGRYVVAVVDDAPVAFAAITPTVLGVVRIGPVHTLPAHRRRGHGASVTAAAVRLARRRGAEETLLFSDLANRTATALYARLGFVGVADHVDMGLRPGHGGSSDQDAVPTARKKV